MSSARGWIVKTDRYGGSVVAGVFDTKSGAKELAKELNSIYQTDEYYVEEWKEAPGV